MCDGAANCGCDLDARFREAREEWLASFDAKSEGDDLELDCRMQQTLARVGLADDPGTCEVPRHVVETARRRASGGPYGTLKRKLNGRKSDERTEAFAAVLSLAAKRPERVVTSWGQTVEWRKLITDATFEAATSARTREEFHTRWTEEMDRRIGELHAERDRRRMQESARRRARAGAARAAQGEESARVDALNMRVIPSPSDAAAEQAKIEAEQRRVDEERERKRREAERLAEIERAWRAQPHPSVLGVPQA